MQNVIISELLRHLSFLRALIAHVCDLLGALNGPQIPRFTFVHHHADSLRTCHENDMFYGVMSYTLYLHPPSENHNMTLVST